MARNQLRCDFLVFLLPFSFFFFFCERREYLNYSCSHLHITSRSLLDSRHATHGWDLISGLVYSTRQRKVWRLGDWWHLVAAAESLTEDCQSFPLGSSRIKMEPPGGWVRHFCKSWGSLTFSCDVTQCFQSFIMKMFWCEILLYWHKQQKIHSFLQIML